MKKRLKALEKKAAAEHLILTESQLVALERKKDDDLACGEIETAHPGYLGSQDTFYVGTLKGVGRVSVGVPLCKSCSMGEKSGRKKLKISI